MTKRALLLLGLAAAACDGAKPMDNTPFTDRIMEHFVPGVRFGDSFAAAAARGSVLEMQMDESGATMRLRLRLRHGVGGLSHVRFQGSPDPLILGDSAYIYGIILYSSPDSAELAAAAILQYAERISTKPGQAGCSGYNAELNDEVVVWEQEEGGGMAMLRPQTRRAAPSDASTRLVVYPRSVFAKDALANFRTGTCPASRR